MLFFHVWYSTAFDLTIFLHALTDRIGCCWAICHIWKTSEFNESFIEECSTWIVTQSAEWWNYRCKKTMPEQSTYFKFNGISITDGNDVIWVYTNRKWQSYILVNASSSSSYNQTWCHGMVNLRCTRVLLQVSLLKQIKPVEKARSWLRS